MKVRPIDANTLKRNWLYGDHTKPFVNFIDTAPTLDYEPVVHAHWKFDKSISPFPICSNCDVVNACCSPYCGGCGAKMDEEVKG